MTNTPGPPPDRLIGDLVAGYRAGGQLVDLADQYGVDVKAIRGLLKSSGVKLRRGPTPTAMQLGPEGLARLAAEYDAGAGLVELGAKYRRDPVTIAKLVRAGGGHMRRPGVRWKAGQ